MKTILYTRSNCSLCVEAAALLAEHGLQPELVDIDANPKLLAQFDCCVPVVELDGKIRFRGRIDVVLLRRLLHHN